MGRPPRQSGHLAGTFAPRKIRPSDGHSSRGESSTQPRQPQPTVSIPIRPQTFQPASPQYRFCPVPGSFTPSTTEAVSPVSSRATLSPGVASVGPSYSAALDFEQYLPIDASTPDSSRESVSRSRDQYYLDHAPQQPAQQQTFTADYVLVQDHEMTVDVMGIETRAPFHETAQYLASSPRFISAKTPSPTRFPRYPGTEGPWSGLPLRQEDPYGGLDTPSPDAMDFILDNSQTQRAREKGGGRKGPLSQTQRQHACEVRKNGACLRCSIMREKCDLQTPCTSCSSKDRRKAPKTCIPKQFNWEGCESTLFPRELAERLRTRNLFRHFSNSSFTICPRATFQIPLDMHIGIPLNVTVQEFYPTAATDVLQAYQPTSDERGSRILDVQTWNPPIIMSLRDEDHVRRQAGIMRKKLSEVFDQVLNSPRTWQNWARQYFRSTAEEFQGDILQLIGEYYRKDLDEHSVIKDSLSLLWWEYLLLNKLTVPRDAWPHLEANLEATKPPGSLVYVIPDHINSFLKGIVLPLAKDAARKLTETLHDLLFKQAHMPKTATRGRTDLALCLLLILKIYIGRTQGALLLLPRTPKDETKIVYSQSQVEKTIKEMDTIGEYFASLHQYTLTRCCKVAATLAEADSPLEVHASTFDLQGRLLQEVMRNHADQRPRSFEVGEFGEGFHYTNVQRLCWKVLASIEHRS